MARTSSPRPRRRVMEIDSSGPTTAAPASPHPDEPTCAASPTTAASRARLRNRRVARPIGSRRISGTKPAAHTGSWGDSMSRQRHPGSCECLRLVRVKEESRVIDQEQINLQGLAWLFTGRSISALHKRLYVRNHEPVHFAFHCIAGRRLCLDARDPLAMTALVKV